MLISNTDRAEYYPRAIFSPRAFTRPLKPHNTLYKERYYYINIILISYLHNIT